MPVRKNGIQSHAFSLQPDGGHRLRFCATLGEGEGSDPQLGSAGHRGEAKNGAGLAIELTGIAEVGGADPVAGAGGGFGEGAELSGEDGGVGSSS